MKEYCVDLEIAKELEKNGFPQTSEMSWYKTEKGKYELLLGEFSVYYDEEYATPFADEILKELPNQIKIPISYDPSLDYLCYLTNYKNKLTYTVGYSNINTLELEGEYFEDKKLSNALALMWLYLKKEGYIK